MSKLNYDGLKTFKAKNDETYIGKDDVVNVNDLEEESDVYDDDIIIKGQAETGDLVRIKAKDFFAKVEDEIGDINSALAELYYRPGDSITFSYYEGAGFVTNSKTDVRFSVPLSKPVSDDVKSVSVSCNLILRQNGSYTHGSSSSVGVTPSSISSTIQGTTVSIVANMSDTTNSSNNDACGVRANSLTITFS